MKLMPYDRALAVDYAQRYALTRNPKYLDFQRLGGDCTNFASQCLYAGSGVMNYTKNTGWYYIDPNDRAPAWTGVRFLYEFLTQNQAQGPFAETSPPERAMPGDLIQLSHGSRYHHTLVILRVSAGEFYVAAHTFDALLRPLSSYDYTESRILHILGVRKPST